MKIVPQARLSTDVDNLSFWFRFYDANK